MFRLTGYNYLFSGKRWYNLCFKYRYDPVPFTGNDPHGRYIRRMRTTQERRYNLSEEHKSFVRGKRRHLPDHYDDAVIISQYDKCWKRHRCRQYK